MGYKILDTLKNDAPFSLVTYYNISFLSPERIDESKNLQVKGFKVYNGYFNINDAKNDSANLKNIHPEHDIFVSSIGSIYVWDDSTRSEAIEYNDKELNDLENVRRENVAKMDLLKEQLKNESIGGANRSDERKDKTKERLKKKAIEKGLVNFTVKEDYILDDEMINKINEANKDDYLDENDIVGFTYGCITFYSPHFVGGINNVYYKLRGLFETLEEVNSRVEELKIKYPDDRIYIFEVGKWTVFNESDKFSFEEGYKRLNYAMKCHLDNMDNEKDEFEKRKSEMIDKNKKESYLNKFKNNDENIDENNKVNETGESKEISLIDIGTNEEKYEINKILEYLQDDVTDIKIEN